MSDQATIWLIHATLVLGAFWAAAVLSCVFSDLFKTDLTRVFSVRHDNMR